MSTRAVDAHSHLKGPDISDLLAGDSKALSMERTMKKIYELLAEKGSEVWSVTPDQTVYEAIERMAQKEVGALPVMQEGKLVGIISERDYTRKVILQGRSSRETQVRDIMTSRVVVVDEDQKIEECLAMVSKFKIRHLPVMKGDTVVGMISSGDLVKTIIDEQQFVIEQLENYIRG